MRVPLIISLPGTLPAGRVVNRTVSLMDIAPTVLSSLGLALPEQVQGRSLKDLLFSDTIVLEEVPVIMETKLPWHSYGWSPSSAIVAESFKFIEAPKPELYDLGADPLELTNLYDTSRGRAATLTTQLNELRLGYGMRSLEGGSSVKMDDETRDRLASLGYTSSGPVSGDPIGDAPDAKDMIGMMNMAKRASALRDKGKEDEAISLLEDVLEKSPDSPTVMNDLGTWYAEKKDFPKAEKLFKRLIQLNPDFIEAYRNLGPVYFVSRASRRRPNWLKPSSPSSRTLQRRTVSWGGSTYRKRITKVLSST